MTDAVGRERQCRDLFRRVGRGWDWPNFLAATNRMLARGKSLPEIERLFERGRLEEILSAAGLKQDNMNR